MEVVEPIFQMEHAGCRVALYPDLDPALPNDWDVLGTPYTFERPDYRGFERADATMADAAERGCLVRYARMAHGEIVVPFRLDDYGSSGAQLYAVDDSRDANGYVATTAARATELGVPDVERALRDEIHEWDAYLQGEVVGYVVESDGETVESVWGFYPERSPLGEPLATLSGMASYSLAWSELPRYLRGYAYCLADALDAAEREQEERERAASQDVATR